MLLIHWSRLNVYPFTLRLSGSSSLVLYHYFWLLRLSSAEVSLTLCLLCCLLRSLSENIELLPWLSHPPLSPSLALHNGKPWCPSSALCFSLSLSLPPFLPALPLWHEVHCSGSCKLAVERRILEAAFGTVSRSVCPDVAHNAHQHNKILPLTTPALPVTLSPFIHLLNLCPDSVVMLLIWSCWEMLDDE